MKKIIIAVIAICLVGYGSYRYFTKSDESDTKTVSKETLISHSDVTVGVTESAAISIDSLSQTFDLSLTSASVSATSSGSSSGSSTNSSSGNSSSGSSGGSGDMAMGGASSGGNSGTANSGSSSGNSSSSGGSSSSGSTSTSTSTSTSAPELIVDEILIKEGESVTKGDAIMSITEASIKSARKELEAAVTSTELALTQAQIDQDDTLLQAKYDYDTRITEGESAEKTYNAALESISSNISVLQSSISETESSISDIETQISEASDDKTSQLESQLSQLETQLENYESELSSAQSSKSADELSAKQTYEQTLMYYENAQSLYDIAVNDVDDATQSAQDDVDTAKENLADFEKYIKNNTIKAEYSGTVSGLYYSSGDTLSSDTAIADFADAQAISVTVSVTEDDISAVNLDDEVDIDFLAYTDEQYKGYISEIGSSTSTSNSNTVSYPVTVIITEYPETILSGMTANVTFITKKVSDITYVSNKAITTEDSKSYIKLANDDGTTEKVEVKTGFSNGTDVEISGDGISEGDKALIESKVKS